MIPLSTALPSGFTFSANWRGFELKQNDQVVATLRRPSVWSSSFLATTANENWVIRRGGFWGSRAEIVDGVSQQPIAYFKSAWGGRGTLTFADGQTFYVVTRGWWHSIWIVTTETEQPVLHLHAREKSVELHNIGLAEGRLLLLALFTLYRVRQAEEAAVAASAAAS